MPSNDENEAGDSPWSAFAKGFLGIATNKKKKASGSRLSALRRRPEITVTPYQDSEGNVTGSDD